MRLLKLFALMFMATTVSAGPLTMEAVKSTANGIRWMVGAQGTGDWDNTSGGFRAALEAPIGTRWEIDASDTYSPFESHVALGHGRANIAELGPVLWLTQSWGLNAEVTDSAYDVTKVTKDQLYADGGAIYRRTLMGYPARFRFNYLQEFHNGITPSGLESSHLIGAVMQMDARIGCLSAFCIRWTQTLDVGRVLTQGNPQCDGSFGGPVTCPRSAAVGGGATVALSFEFPRRRGHEYDVF